MVNGPWLHRCWFGLLWNKVAKDAWVNREAVCLLCVSVCPSVLSVGLWAVGEGFENAKKGTEGYWF